MTESTTARGSAAFALTGFGERTVVAPPDLGRTGRGVVQISHEVSRGEFRNVHVGQATCASSPSGDGDGEAEDMSDWLG